MLGKSVHLTTARKFLIDLFWIAKRVPVGVIGGRINMAALITARNNCAAPPPFTVIFAKALALVAGKMPELRQNYIRYPIPHLFETIETSVAVLIEREIDGQTAVMPVLLKSPRTRTLGNMADELLTARTAPQNDVRQIRRLLGITRLPLPIRRLLWLAAYHSGRQRSNYMGSFGISTLGSQGQLITHPLTPVTTCLTYGPFDAEGYTDIRIGFDHRVYDGSTVARTMAALEKCLNAEMVLELQKQKSS